MTHPSDPNKFIIESDLGNIEVGNGECRNTTLNGVAPELPWDTTFDGVLENAQRSSNGRLSAEEIRCLRILNREKGEDFDGTQS